MLLESSEWRCYIEISESFVNPRSEQSAVTKKDVEADGERVNTIRQRSVHHEERYRRRQVGLGVADCNLHAIDRVRVAVRPQDISYLRL